jgi:hypothetical protein
MKYLIVLGMFVLGVAGYFLLILGPPAVVAQDPVAIAQTEQSLSEIAAEKRQTLPTVLSETITLNDAVFLPRLRIMEYAYATSTSDNAALQSFVDSRAETLCLEVKDMSGTGVTLRNILEDLNGNVLRRIYLLDEDCQRFY